MTPRKRRTTLLSGKEKLRVRRALLRRDGESCAWCRLPMGEDITFDHLLPRVKGGTDRIDNLVLAHAACNAARSNPKLGRRRTKEDGALVTERNPA